jgi:hypothetical protein
LNPKSFANKTVIESSKHHSVEQAKPQRVKTISQIKFQKAKRNYSKQTIKKIIKNPRNIVATGSAGTSANLNIGAYNTDVAWVKSIISSKQHSVKRKSKHSRSISKNSGRRGRGTSQSKRTRKEKNLTIDLNSLSQSAHQSMGTQNKSHNHSTNQISSNKASRYSQLIGV